MRRQGTTKYNNLSIEVLAEMCNWLDHQARKNIKLITKVFGEYQKFIEDYNELRDHTITATNRAEFAEAKSVAQLKDIVTLNTEVEQLKQSITRKNEMIAEHYMSRE
jgi:hypothetical protein